MRRRAAAAGQSLPEYLRTRLIAEAERPSLDEVLDPPGERAGGSLSFRGGGLDQRRAMLALGDLAELPLQRAPHEPLLVRCWELKDNLTVDDAAYVALAEAMAAVLVTADARMAAATGPRCTIELIAASR